MGSVAVIGAGVSGLTAAHYLSRKHEVTLFEASDYLGGHTDTHDIKVDNKAISVDTGFIVFNDRTYPNFIKLLDELGCRYLPTEMSFSIKASRLNLEYNGHNLNSLFAQRSNLFRPSFLKMVNDILRFNREAPGCLKDELNLTIGEYLRAKGYSHEFQNHYLLPMAAAIWSTGSKPVRQFPVKSLVRFFDHHGLLSIRNRPQWFVLEGGSRSYVDRLRQRLARVRLSTPVHKIVRDRNAVTVQGIGFAQSFDQVVIATHSDQALALLEDPTPREQAILGDIHYTPNKVTLHSDESVLPTRSLARASWNYNLDGPEGSASLTYDMNRLQHLDTKKPVLVTLNDRGSIDPKKVIKELHYAHPFFDHRMLAAQERHDEISGMNRTHYAGAYWRNGFHEDGVVSALKVCKALGVRTC